MTPAMFRVLCDRISPPLTYQTSFAQVSVALVCAYIVKTDRFAYMVCVHCSPSITDRRLISHLSLSTHNVVTGSLPVSMV